VGSTVENVYPIKWITPQVAVGYAPHSQTDVDAIKALGIEAVLNLCAECYDLHEIESAAGLEVYWLPIADEDAPEPGAAQKALEWLDSMLAQNKKVLVHCRFGIGRTGTLVTAWLLTQGYALDDALEMLSHTPTEPNSRRQWDFLKAFSLSIGKPAVQKPANLEKRRSRLGKFFRKYALMNDWWSK
jgi:protein-tyrosine phosphatase